MPVVVPPRVIGRNRLVLECGAGDAWSARGAGVLEPVSSPSFVVRCSNLGVLKSGRDTSPSILVRCSHPQVLKSGRLKSSSNLVGCPNPRSQAGRTSSSLVPSWKTVPRAALWTFFCQNAIARVKTLHSSVCLVRSISIYDPATVLLIKHKDVYLLLGGKVLLYL